MKVKTTGRVREIVVAVGRETYSPIDYQSFEVPPLSLTVELGVEDEIEDVAESALAVLRKIQKAEFENRKAAFMKRAIDTAADAKVLIARKNQATRLASSS